MISLRPARMTLTLFLIVGFPATASAQDSNVAELQEFVVSGVRDARSRLRSGVVTITGSVTHVGGSSPEDYADGLIEMFIAFDVDANRLRFDRRQPVIRVDADDPSVRELVSRGGKLISCADQTIRWHELGNELVRIEPPGWPRGGVIAPFDVRTVGHFGWLNLDRGTAWERVLDMLERPVSDLRVRDERYYELFRTAAMGSIAHQTMTVFDAERGFSPMRWEVRSGKSADGEWLSPNEVVTTEWNELNEVWVPARFHQEHKPGPRSPLTIRELEFEWTNVNEPVHDEYFTLPGLGLPEGTMRVWANPTSERHISLIGMAFNDDVRGPYLETRETIAFITDFEAWTDDIVGRRVSISGTITPHAIQDGDETFDASQLESVSWSLVDDVTDE